MIEAAIHQLECYKTWCLTLDRTNRNERILICVSDIDRCIETGYYYINHNELFEPGTFTYDSMLIKMADSIKDNNFGILLSEAQKEAVPLFYNLLVTLAEDLILANNKMRV